MIPVGGACGYALGGVIAQAWSWSAIFFLEGLVMLPMCVLVYFIPRSRSAPTGIKKLTTARLSETSVTEMHQSGVTDVSELDRSVDMDGITDSSSLLSEGGAASPSVWANIYVLLSTPTYMLLVLGYAAYTFVIGGFAYWIPDFLVDAKGMKLVDADLGIGMVTVICGLAGTAIGGYLLDKAGGSHGPKGLQLSIKHATIYAVLGTPFAFLAFIGSLPLWAFFVLIGTCQLLLFCTTGPINSALLSSVPPDLRSLAMAISIFCIHALGDMPSPILVGAISDATGSLYGGMYFLTVWLIWPMAMWFLAWRQAKKEGTRMTFRSDPSGFGRE
eukprot:TRINITY_DN5564_c0_g1_i4.p1 TRINITY_DN5564_c0_g1~~TRINITY_DN5564_c0_g1_i4.p1  ORF type:complete len:330 (-),score=82.53 TRINITY_DN5564_c0_g1_i4:304-1293(-)